MDDVEPLASKVLRLIGNRALRSGDECGRLSGREVDAKGGDGGTSMSGISRMLSSSAFSASR
jgi:hypothetical protein